MAEHSNGAFRTSIGGQALIEGILMRGPEKQAIVVRDKDGRLVEKVEELKLIKDRYPILGVPLIRGTVNFLAAMVSGVKALMYSADFYPDEEVSQPFLLLNAKNDPFSSGWALPREDEVSRFVTCDYPEEGGHIGFPTGRFPGELSYLPHRIMRFFDTGG